MLQNLIKKIFSAGKRGQADFAGKNILVVDDGEVERKFVSHALEKLGFNVMAVEDGFIALDIIKKQPVDLIILDFYMPKMNGKAICSALKADPKSKDIPVIFLTGSASPKDIIDCYDVGAEYFLTKPISANQLTKQVQSIFNELQPEIEPA
ncbi:MAG TPA: response regulator [Candidatus Omnitrophota bacterium]|nr:response regulator [Candidatus Omnitrophota bacterium]HPB68923.1 response regulator [Candidatus Omnitrophota bacterium]HQO58669.1 response regulator [Candidatus Omnitrophota bacterium]HQP12292.1 response regulator [Candidatus Omnitrophota bacterium]